MQTNIVLGIDFGLKYIGIAIGQSISSTARPLCCIQAINGKPDWQKIAQTISTWQPGKIILGDPGSSNQNLKQIQNMAKKFADRITMEHKIPIIWVDESLSTWEAKQRLKLQSKQFLSKNQVAKVNSESACILLEQWLSANTH